MAAAGSWGSPIDLDSDNDGVGDRISRIFDKSTETPRMPSRSTNMLDRAKPCLVTTKGEPHAQNGENRIILQPPPMSQTQPVIRGPPHQPDAYLNDHFYNNDQELNPFIAQQAVNNIFYAGPETLPGPGHMHMPNGLRFPFLNRIPPGPANLANPGQQHPAVPPLHVPRQDFHGPDPLQWRPAPPLPEVRKEYLNPVIDQQSQRQDGGNVRALESQVDEAKAKACLDRVLELFPTISHTYVLKKYTQRAKKHQQNQNSSTRRHPFDIPFETIVEDILETGGKYPEQIVRKRKREPEPDDKSAQIDYANLNSTKSNAYILSATQVLSYEFEHIPTRHIKNVVKLKQSLFKAYQLLKAQDIESYTLATGGQKPFRRLKQPREVWEKKYTLRRQDLANDPELQQITNEYEAAVKHWEDENARRQRQRESVDLEAANFVQAQQDGALIDCGICYDPFPINRSISCEGEEIHFFCYGCVEQYAKSQMGMMRSAMNCMCCSEPLAREFLAHALDAKTLSRLEDLQQRQELKDAEVEGLEECPYCDFRAQCPPIEVDKVFNCENCEVVSCRLCRKEAHLPLSCDEASEDSRLARRHRVEEAMSASLMRRCPKCDIAIVKSDGCNKITCPASNCKTLICFVCKKDITTIGYNHFQSAHRSRHNHNMCPLHDSSKVNRNEEDVKRAEQGQIKALREEQAGLENEDLEVSRHIRG